MMPYKMEGPDEDGKYRVVNEDGEVKAKHSSKEDAEKQIRLLHMLEREHGE